MVTIRTQSGENKEGTEGERGKQIKSDNGRKLRTVFSYIYKV